MSQDAAQSQANQIHCAVVTGGARNIGQAIALRLQKDGYRVVVVDIVEPEAQSLQAIPTKSTFLMPMRLAVLCWIFPSVFR